MPTDTAPIREAIRKLLAAVQATPLAYPPISAGHQLVFDLLATKAGSGLARVWEESDRGVKLVLRKLLNKVYEGAHWFRTNPGESEDLLIATLASISPKPSPNDPRDKFCYQMKTRKKSNAWIKLKVDERKRWEPITTEAGIPQAARRYAERKNLPWPIPR
jgi:hypothetical protein